MLTNLLTVAAAVLFTTVSTAAGIPTPAIIVPEPIPVTKVGVPRLLAAARQSVFASNISAFLGYATQDAELNTLLTTSGLRYTTVIAPHNDALNAAVASLTDALGATEAQVALKDVLRYHFSVQRYPITISRYWTYYGLVPTLLSNDNEFTDLPQGLNQTMKFELRPNWNQFKLNGVQAIGSVIGSNGVMHVTNDVLLPPMNLTTTLTMLNYNKFLAALLNYPTLLAEAQGTGVTIFPVADELFTVNNTPYNPSYQQLAKHVVPSGVYTAALLLKRQSVASSNGDLTINSWATKIKVDGADVVKRDVLLSNGVAHELKRFIVAALPPPPL